MLRASRHLWRVALICALPVTAMADERAIGQVTKLPLPRFVSMKASEGNVRRGPSQSHRIDWIFKRKDIPLEITAEHGHWRRIRDRDGAGGWMHYSLLSGVRTAIVETDMVEMKGQPDAQALNVAQLETGVIARVQECGVEWCRIQSAGYRGWVRKADLWGVKPGETLE